MVFGGELGEDKIVIMKLKSLQSALLGENLRQPAFRSVARNTTILLVIVVIKDGLSLLFVTYLARSLGASLFGRYSVATSYIAISMMILDLGAGKLLTREISKNRNESPRLITAFLMPKPIAMLVTLLLAGLIAVIMAYDSILSVLVYESVLVGFFMAIAVSARAVFHAFQKMEYDGVGLILERIVSFLGAVVVIKLGMGVVGILGALVVGSLVDATTSWALVRAKFVPRISRSDFTTSRRYIKQGLPILVTAVSSTVYLRANTLIVERVLGDTSAGYFNVAFQLFIVFLYFPQMLGLSLFPIFSEMHAHRPDSLATTWKRLLPLMTLFGIIIGLAGVLLAPKLVHILFSSKFEPSVVVLQLLLLSLPFTFASGVLAQVMVATDRQHLVARATLLVMILSLGLNILLIPKFHLLGAALTMVVSQMSFLVAYVVALRLPERTL